jgi:hypothetical protein
VDPLGFAAGDANLYRFESDAPPMYTDPSGLVGVFFSGAGREPDKDTDTMSWLEQKYQGRHRYRTTPGFTYIVNLSGIIPGQVVDVDDNEVLLKGEQQVLEGLFYDACHSIDLFGYSRGGIFAVALAKKLHAAGIKVRFLGDIDPVATGTNYANRPLTVPHNVQVAWSFHESKKDDEWDRRLPTNWDSVMLLLYLSGTVADYTGPSGGFFQTKRLDFAHRKSYGPPASHSQMGHYHSGPGRNAKDDLVTESSKVGVKWAKGV